MIRRIGLYLVLLLAVAGVSGAVDEIKVKTAGGLQKIEASGDADGVYFSLSHLNEMLGGKVEWTLPGYSVRFVLDTNMMLFTVGSPYVQCNGSVYNLSLPIKIVRGALFVPARTFTPLLDVATAEAVSWDGDGKTLRIDSEWFNITDLTVNAKQNGVLVEIFLSSPLRYDIYESEGRWINVDFPEGRVNRTKVIAGADRTMITKVKAYQFENSAQVSFQLARPYKQFHPTFKTNPGRLQIAVEDSAYTPDTAATGLTRIGPDEKIDVIVIDPGHGGDDFGAIGRQKKTREKDINLEIAKELSKLIRKDKQFKVVMTRLKDVTVPLDERARTANDAQADMFVSIHCNASPKRSANGFQIFYLAPAKTDAARAAAQLENAPFLVADPNVDTQNTGDLAFILNDMIQSEFSSESADLAYMADMELRKKLGIESRGVDHAGFIVLNRVYMPSVLIESAFISNAVEEKLLRDKAYRVKVAEGIYNAIKRFKTKYER
jgi:N-acetylmuramoyl-L-alanine amidase